MDQILIFINNWGTTIAGILTASGTIYLFVKRCIKKMKPYLDIFDKLVNLEKKIDGISKEFKPNGGSSVRDTLNCLAKDIKENTEATKRIENRQSFSMNLADYPCFETDQTGKCIFVNDSYARLMERPKEELLGAGWILGVLEEDRDSVIKEWKDAVRGKRNFERTISLVNRHNEEFVVKCIAVRQTDGVGYLGYYSNITKA